MKRKSDQWYIQPWFIAILFIAWPTGVAPIIGIILLILHHKAKKEDSAAYEEVLSQKRAFEAERDSLESQLESLGAKEYFEVKAKIDQLTQDLNASATKVASLTGEIVEKSDKVSKLETQIKTNLRKINGLKALYNAMDYSIANYATEDFPAEKFQIPANDLDELEALSPSILLKLHSMDVKDLRKAFNDNNKAIDQLLKQYSSRYTTKANKSIYDLIVISLRSELQNVLYNIKFEKLEKSIEDIKSITTKYLKIVSDGNQSIATTLVKFIGEIEYLFINAVKIEYNYYVKREQARQEQLALREQMRQEAEERKALEAEKKKIDAEEEKYQKEINKLQEMLSSARQEELDALNARILTLQVQLSEVVIKKEEIVNLQNGKAGNVYIISNLGSFGDKMFKVGLTRRIDPQDRVNELGDASVPFRFDVHSFIFSEDAVGLENDLHKRLNDKRVNKVNLRKEFFYTTVDELEALVNELDPTAEFNRTMLAEEYNQSLSSAEAYTSDISEDDSEEDEMEQE